MNSLNGVRCLPVRPAQAGFNLIELMVAITISLLMMAAILQLMLDVTRTNDEMAKTNGQIENGRFSIQLMADDLVHAGFWNGYIPQFDDLTATAIPSDLPAFADLPGDVADPCLAFASWTPAYKNYLLGAPVEVYEDVPAGCAGLITDKKAGTDMLVVRHADTCVADSSSSDCPDTADEVYFQSSFCASESPYAYVLDDTGFNLHKRDCLEDAEKRRYVSTIYYIATGNILKRTEFGGGDDAAWSTPQPLIEGIEGFAVELGIDSLSKTGAAVDYTAAVSWSNPLNKTTPTNRGDGAPDGDYVRCPDEGCTDVQLANAVSVKLHVLVRNLEKTPGYSDGKTYALGAVSYTPTGEDKKYKRHLYSTTVRLNNVSTRRETP